MSKPRLVHFLGELPGIGEDLIHKLVCNNIRCSIVDIWFEILMSKMSTELEIFTERPLLFNPDLVHSNDLLFYFALHEHTVDIDALAGIGCDVILLLDGNSRIDVHGTKLNLIYIHDLISFSEVESLANKNLDELFDLCISNARDFNLPSDNKHWWVSQQDVATGLVRLINHTSPLPQLMHICGRRGWTNQETFAQLELLYNRTIAGSSGEFQTSHLELKPVIHPTVAKVSQITSSTRPDLSIINEVLLDIDGEDWRPLIPLRTSLMHYLATKKLV
jgi:hypothetical protein